MHILFREQRDLDEAAAAVELGHSPADLVLLSFSDADLGAAAMAWRHLGPARPGLRLANLAQLRHPDAGRVRAKIGGPGVSGLPVHAGEQLSQEVHHGQPIA